MEFRKGQKVYVFRIFHGDIAFGTAYVYNLDKDLIKVSMKKDHESEAFEVNSADYNKLFFINEKLARGVFEALPKKYTTGASQEYGESFNNGLKIFTVPSIYRLDKSSSSVDIRDSITEIVKGIRARQLSGRARGALQQKADGRLMPQKMHVSVSQPKNESPKKSPVV